MGITKPAFYAFFRGSATAGKRDIIALVNWSVLLLVLGVALAAAVVAALWPYLSPESPLWAQQRLAEVWRAWERVRDLRAGVTVLRPGEPPLRLRLLYLAGAAVRLELEEPLELAGEVYTLRPVEGGWLFVHFRPRLELGLEARFPLEALETFLSLSPREGVEVRWPKESTFVLRGLAGPFSEVEVQTAGDFSLPERVVLRGGQSAEVEVRVVVEAVNAGLELRELLSLDPLPTRWIRIPALPAPGA